MLDHEDLGRASDRSRCLQRAIRRDTFAPDVDKQLRRFSAWEAATLILKVNQKTLAKKIQTEGLPAGELSGDRGAMRWFSLEELNAIRSSWTDRGAATLRPRRPAGKRAIRLGVANFKGGAGKSTTALHFAHAAALDGYRVLLVDFDPQATLSHAMGLVDVAEERTVWGVIARDLLRETRRLNLLRELEGGGGPPATAPDSLRGLGLDGLGPDDFIAPTCWPTIDMIGSCANAAFVEFATGEYRLGARRWTFFAAVDRFLGALPPDRYDIVIFDCPPAIGYNSLSAVFAADVLYVPTGPGYWEYDSTTSFLAQLSEALEEMALSHRDQDEMQGLLPKRFHAVKVLLTRFEPTNALHASMLKGLRRAFDGWVTEHPIEMTRAVEQSGRFLQSVYEIDYRTMTRETWRRARSSFDRAYGEMLDVLLEAWDAVDAPDQAPPSEKTPDRSNAYADEEARR